MSETGLGHPEYLLGLDTVWSLHGTPETIYKIKNELSPLLLSWNKNKYTTYIRFLLFYSTLELKGYDNNKLSKTIKIDSNVDKSTS